MGIVILQLLTIFILIILSLALWGQRLSDRRRLGFVFFSFSLAAWIGIGILANTENDYTLLFNRLIFIAPLWIMWSAHYFVTKLVDNKASNSLSILTGLVVFASLVTGYSGYVAADIIPRIVEGQIKGFDVERGILYPLYIIFLLFIIIVMLWNLRKQYLRAEGTLRSQLGTVGAGIAGAVAAGMVLAVIIPIVTGSSASSEYAFLAGLITVTGFMLAIVRHRLFDVKLAAVRSVAYLLSLMALAAVYYLAAYLISTVVFQERASTTFSVSPLNIFLALILAFIFQPVKQFFDQVTDRIFYRNRYDTSDFLIRIGRILTSTTELHVVLDEVGKEIRQTLKASTSLFVVYRDHHPNELVSEGIDERFGTEDLSELDSFIVKGGLLAVDKLKTSSEAREQALYEILSEKRIALVLPLVSAEEVIGYLMLGEHKAGTYTKQDMEALEAMANELVIAVQNARAVQAIRDLNAHLEQRVEAATSELLSSNEKLRRLDTTKDEFLSMASHQLRTPLTSVKGYISMVLEGDAGKITPMQKQLLGEAFVSSERMVHLIGDFLNVSRLQTGKFVLDKNLVNLADLVGEEVDGLKATAKSRSLKLQYRKPTMIPSLYIDGGKIHQVIMNFIDNAIYYSTENTAITVKLVVEEGFLVFTVQDSGIGVPKSEQAGLFTKFFRATNARRQRPDGTGIGLYLAKKVIDAHDGTMVFSSTEGKGSTFGFRLPIKKLSEMPSTPENIAGVKEAAQE